MPAANTKPLKVRERHLVARNCGLVYMVVRRILRRRPWAEYLHDDLVGAGWFGLMAAANVALACWVWHLDVEVTSWCK